MTGFRGRSVAGSIGTRSSFDNTSCPPTNRPNTVCLPIDDGLNQCLVKEGREGQEPYRRDEDIDL